MNWKLNANANACGTSFHGHTINGNKKFFKNLLGEDLGPSGDGKVSFEYFFENEKGDIATLYDWKGDTSCVHIGATSQTISENFYKWFTEKYL